MLRPIYILAGCVLFSLQTATAQNYSSNTPANRSTAAISEPSDAQYEVYLRNSGGVAGKTREAIIAALPAGEVDYLRKEIKNLGVIVHVDMTGKVTYAEVDYFTPNKISEKSKKTISNIIKANFSYDYSKRALAYFQSIKKHHLTFYYTLPVHSY